MGAFYLTGREGYICVPYVFICWAVGLSINGLHRNLFLSTIHLGFHVRASLFVISV